MRKDASFMQISNRCTGRQLLENLDLNELYYALKDAVWPSGLPNHTTGDAKRQGLYTYDGRPTN